MASPDDIKRIRAFVKSVCDEWPNALTTNTRERAAVVAHLTTALGYRQNASNNYANNAVGAAANMLFGVKASADKTEFTTVFWETFAESSSG